MKRKILSILLIIFMLSASLIIIPVNAKIINDGDDSWVWDYDGIWEDQVAGGIAEYESLHYYLSAHDSRYGSYAALHKGEVTSLYLKHLDRLTIKDLTGLYDFTGLQQLVIEYPNEETQAALEALTLSRLTSLEKLSLTDVDVSNLRINVLGNLTYLEIYDYENIYSTTNEYNKELDLSGLTDLTHFTYSITIDAETSDVEATADAIAEYIEAPDGFDVCYTINNEAQAGIEIIYSLVEEIKVSIKTDRKNYGLADQVICTVSWDKPMQAAELVVWYTPEKLEFVSSSIDEDFIDTTQDTRLTVSWASFDEIDTNEISFTFDVVDVGDGSSTLYGQVTLLASGELDSTYKLPGMRMAQFTLDSDYLKEEATIDIIEIASNETISNLTLTNNKVTVQNLIDSNYFDDGVTVKAYNANNEEITDTSLGLGSGSYVHLYDGEELVRQFRVIVYGDANGDGEITPLDALTVIHAKNQKISISEFCSEAGKVFSRDTEGLPNAIDALAIIKHLNDKYEIKQSY